MDSVTSLQVDTHPLEQLRRVSRHVHAEVDQAFSFFDLSDSRSYGAFLQAHAVALMTAEAFVERCPALPDWRRRSGLIASDLGAMAISLPLSQTFVLTQGTPEAWGVLYVLEGSRLGGRVLAKRLAAGLPRDYLAAEHEKGEWSRFLAELQLYLATLSSSEQSRVAHAVVETFSLFRRSAETVSG